MDIKSKHRKILRIIGWLGSIAALIYMIYRLAIYEHYDELWQTFSSAQQRQWLALTAALLGLPLQLAIETKRWQTLLTGIASPTGREAFEQVLSGNIAAFITPWRIGEYPARLIKAGLDKELDLRNWKHWLNNPRKWICFLFLTLARYIVWGLQLWAVLYVCGISLSPWQACCSIAAYYVAVSVFPTIPAADVALKGGWAILIFGAYTTCAPQITIAVSLIWLINTILPILYYECTLPHQLSR